MPWWLILLLALGAIGSISLYSWLQDENARKLNLVIVGPRRSGKTCLSYALENLLSRKSDINCKDGGYDSTDLVNKVLNREYGRIRLYRIIETPGVIQPDTKSSLGADEDENSVIQRFMFMKEASKDSDVILYTFNSCALVGYLYLKNKNNDKLKLCNLKDVAKIYDRSELSFNDIYMYVSTIIRDMEFFNKMQDNAKTLNSKLFIFVGTFADLFKGNTNSYKKMIDDFLRKNVTFNYKLIVGNLIDQKSAYKLVESILNTIKERYS